MTNTTKNITNEENWEDVKTSWVSWGVPQDNIEGTLIDVREIESQLPGKEGEKVKVYEIKADRGFYHTLDEKKNPVKEATIVEAGETYSVSGRVGIDAQMRRIVIGQKVRMVFTEEKAAKTKGFNPLKIIKVQTNGKTDDAWLEGREITAGDM